MPVRLVRERVGRVMLAERVAVPLRRAVETGKVELAVRVALARVEVALAKVEVALARLELEMFEVLLGAAVLEFDAWEVDEILEVADVDPEVAVIVELSEMVELASPVAEAVELKRLVAVAFSERVELRVAVADTVELSEVEVVVALALCEEEKVSYGSENRSTKEISPGGRVGKGGGDVVGPAKREENQPNLGAGGRRRTYKAPGPKTVISASPTELVVAETLVMVTRSDEVVTCFDKLMVVAEPSALRAPNVLEVPSDQVKVPPSTRSERLGRS